MNFIKFFALVILTVFLTGCAAGYKIVVVNSSEQTIEIDCMVQELWQYQLPKVINVEDWKSEGGIFSLWADSKKWRSLGEDEYETDAQKHRKIIKLAPKQVLMLDNGAFNPQLEKSGNMTRIEDLKIKTAKGEASFNGNGITTQWENDGGYFTKTYKYEIKD